MLIDFNYYVTLNAHLDVEAWNMDIISIFARDYVFLRNWIEKNSREPRLFSTSADLEEKKAARIKEICNMIIKKEDATFYIANPEDFYPYRGKDSTIYLRKSSGFALTSGLPLVMDKELATHLKILSELS